MHLDDAEFEPLKKWIIKKLEDISDADSDVLADYVLALLKTDESEAVAKANCIENLHDFLLANTESFVNDVFNSVITKSYDPSRPPPSKPIHSMYQPHTRAKLEPSRQSNESRKRSFNDWDQEENQSSPIHAFQGGDRPIKQARRGGRGGFEQRGGRQSQPIALQHAASPYGQMMANLPAMPPGMPPFDPNNPMAAFLAFQQAMGMMPPGMQGFADVAAAQNRSNHRSGQRCRIYDTEGFCARGTSCPYEHGNDALVVPQNNDEYDPSHANLLNAHSSRNGSNERGRGGHKRRGRGDGKRADIIHHGPKYDKSSTTVVVDQIPEDRLDEESVQQFFAEFGPIEKITMQPYKRLAIVKYIDHDSAQAAYDSPRVIFDNRFVKVYWHKSGGNAKSTDGHYTRHSQKRGGADIEMEDAEPEIDPAEIAKRQEEAQRKHDENRKKMEEAEKQKQDLDVKLKAMEAERQKMAQILAKRTGNLASTTEPSPNGGGNGNSNDETSEQTKVLRAQLAKLEAEAKSLGIDPDAPTNGWRGSSYRGRGGFRGRPRGRGYGYSYRGGWQMGGAVGGGGAVMRLDNRPKTVSVSFLEGTYEDYEETLRNFLLFNSPAGESASLTPHPSRKDAALVAFPERYLGENFMVAAIAPDFPLNGKVEMSWHKGPVVNGTQHTDGAMDVSADHKVAQGENVEPPPTADMDVYDVVDDDDRWG